MKFDLAAKLIWHGGDDVYSGGKKDIATLYEYWLFFKLLEVLNSVFQIESKDINNLIKPTNDGLSLQLKQGEYTALKGVYNKGNRKLNIKFNYNRSFNANYDVTKSGSWTTTLRPDYTLSIWPHELSDEIAEKKEQIVHIHFDAKYKATNINKILNGKSEEDLDTEKNENLRGVYKNADLLKMHAYKDAIRRTSGAYILYPGDEIQELKRFHEILPGLGAFAIKPNKNSANNNKETEHLKIFIEEVLEHFLNRATQRENLSTKTYQITTPKPSNSVKEPMPEYLNNKKLIPDETYVLVGFTNSKKKMDWFKNNGLYNFRMNDEKGSLVFETEIVNAKFLLIRESGKSQASKLFKIAGGIRVFSKERLTELDHPDATKDHYLVYGFEKECTEIKDFKNARWNFKELKAYKKTVDGKNIRYAAGLPFATTLAKLMATKSK